jgi:CheY-specific phosphatase CheX
MSASNQLQPEIVDGFMSVVLRCLKTTVGVEAVVAAAEDADPTAPTIAVAVDLKGDIRGPVTWVFPPEIALELVRRLMEDPNPAPETAADGAAELANILTGHATEVLESYGFRCELGPPRMHQGKLPPGVNVRISTPTGPIDLVFSVSSGSAE